MGKDKDAFDKALIEEQLKSIRFSRCFACEHFDKTGYACDGKRLWLPLMFQDDWHKKMTTSHFPIG